MSDSSRRAGKMRIKQRKRLGKIKMNMAPIPEERTNNVNKSVPEESIDATDTEISEFLNGNNSLCKELSGFVNMKEYGVSYEEGLKMPLSKRGFAIQSLMENKISEERLKNPYVGYCVGDNGRIICEFPPLW